MTSEAVDWPGRPSALAFTRILLKEPGMVAEVRAPTVRRGQYSTNASGYFDDAERLVSAAASLDGVAEGVYVTLNPVRPELLARASNRLAFGAKHATADSDIVARRILGVDFDPVRPAGISSSAEEKGAAQAVADEAKEYLRSLGFPEPLEADSGNGAHLDYLVDLPADDDEMVADLEAEIARVKARAAAKEAKGTPDGQALILAVRAIEKAGRVASETGNKEIVAALDSARAALAPAIVSLGIRIPEKARRGRRKKSTEAA